MTNKFEISGNIVSYGTTNGKDFLEVYTAEDIMPVFLADNNVNALEKKYGDLTERTCIATGYLVANKNDDFVSVVATKVIIK